ncbi:HEAT repeat domain-containing protein [Peristeroidobacter agariperforans]|uniref:HEAT repeat domain-containing protein n=1 Tax=Peristeroidobacter agariperforans TaxID=268404 RepID=UPI00101E04AB|nr:HEAT repeat domain-containing protein [Peristeroidobacter agariperforans]
MPSISELDEIPWERLSHAYGVASDVPGQIRCLYSGAPAERERAIEELFPNIWHQGTVYEATDFALPFLIELLRNKGVPEPQRDDLALLIACILSGRGYWEAHQAVTTLNPFTKKPIPHPPDLEQRITRERQIVADVRERGLAALGLLVPYLKHPHADIRRTVAEAFAHYPLEANTLIPHLQDALGVESDDEVRPEMANSLDTLQQNSRSTRS